MDSSGNYAGSVAQWGQTDAQYIKVVASASGGGASSGGDASIEVSDTAPDPAEDGDLWFNTTHAELYVYVDAENAWIQTNSGGGSGGGGGGWVNG